MFKLAAVIIALGANSPAPVAVVPLILDKSFATLAECDAARESKDMAEAFAALVKEIQEKHEGVKVSIQSKCFDFQNQVPVDDGSI